VEPDAPADARSLFLLYSNTKVVTAAALWMLAEDGLLRFSDTVAQHVPGFEAHGKGGVTVLQLLTHQGGFPSARCRKAAWEDHDLLRRTVCGFTLEWTPGSRVVYHPASAHWTAAVLIEALAGEDFRAFIRRRVVAPLGLEDELFVGLPDAEHGRAAGIYDPPEEGGASRPDAGEHGRGAPRRHPRAAAATAAPAPWRPSTRCSRRAAR
jgi:CubicO group peptidase (beta-lactamase class C family)